MCTLPLSETLVKDLCERYSNQKIENGLKLLSYSLKSASDAPAGFQGCHEVLSVIIQTNLTDAPHEIIFFVKTKPTEAISVQNYLEEYGVFKKEVSVYRHLLPKLQEGWPEFSPRCYYAKDNVLVFEHLGEMGFQMVNERSGLLDFQHLICALSAVASFHASSIVFETKNQIKISEIYPDIVKENGYPSDINNIRHQNYDYTVVALCEIIKIMPEFKDSNRLEYILQKFKSEMNKIFDIVKPSKKYLNVLNHGDLWANNFLFKYENERPVQSRIVDFQLTRYAPPILDVITLITIPTSKEFRVQHLDSLLDSYYFMLGYFLKQQEFQIENILPRDQFDESVRELKILGLIKSCFYSHVTILPPDLAKTVMSNEGFEQFFKNKRSEIGLTAFKIDMIYRNRLSDMLSDFINTYVLV